jgi:hypothetical protein
VLEAVQRRIERALLDLQRIAGDLLDPQQRAVACRGPTNREMSGSSVPWSNSVIDASHLDTRGE